MEKEKNLFSKNGYYTINAKTKEGSINVTIPNGASALEQLTTIESVKKLFKKEVDGDYELKLTDSDNVLNLFIKYNAEENWKRKIRTDTDYLDLSTKTENVVFKFIEINNYKKLINFKYEFEESKPKGITFQNIIKGESLLILITNINYDSSEKLKSANLILKADNAETKTILIEY